MEFKRLGESDVQLPEIGLGTWKYHGGVDSLRAGIEHGATLIDTAEIYGTEEVVGEAIRGLRSQVFLATKVRPRNFRYRDLLAAADRSLRRLATEYIDLLQLHWPNYLVPIEETMAALEELVDAGKVRFIGVSNFSVSELQAAQAAMTKYKIVSNQVRYSLVERTIERQVLHYCKQHKITVIAFSPLGSSFSRIRAADTGDVLGQLAKSSHKTEAQVALNWLLAKEAVVAIPKTSSVSHAIEDCGASGWRLLPEEYNLLETKVRSTNHGWLWCGLRNCKRRLAQSIGYQL